jgi:hypothetical protein
VFPTFLCTKRLKIRDVNEVTIAYLFICMRCKAALSSQAPHATKAICFLPCSAKRKSSACKLHMSCISTLLSAGPLGLRGPLLPLAAPSVGSTKTCCTWPNKFTQAPWATINSYHKFKPQIQTTNSRRLLGLPGPLLPITAAPRWAIVARVLSSPSQCFSFPSLQPYLLAVHGQGVYVCACGLVCVCSCVCVSVCVLMCVCSFVLCTSIYPAECKKTGCKTG